MTTIAQTLTALLYLSPVLIAAAVMFTAVCLAFRGES